MQRGSEEEGVLAVAGGCVSESQPTHGGGRMAKEKERERIDENLSREDE